MPEWESWRDFGSFHGIYKYFLLVKNQQRLGLGFEKSEGWFSSLEIGF